MQNTRNLHSSQKRRYQQDMVSPLTTSSSPEDIAKYPMVVEERAYTLHLVVAGCRGGGPETWRECRKRYSCSKRPHSPRQCASRPRLGVYPIPTGRRNDGCHCCVVDTIGRVQSWPRHSVVHKLTTHSWSSSFRFKVSLCAGAISTLFPLRSSAFAT